MFIIFIKVMKFKATTPSTLVENFPPSQPARPCELFYLRRNWPSGGLKPVGFSRQPGGMLMLNLKWFDEKFDTGDLDRC
jgi:hypothetical protein